MAALHTTLANADYGSARERITYGNPKGRGILEDLHDLKEMMKRLEGRITSQQTQITSQITSQQTQITSQQTEISDLQYRVKALSLCSEEYRKIRNRFLEYYRQDILDDTDKHGKKRTHQGNEAAHEGDAIADAELYTSGERADESVLVDLYGLSAIQIAQLGKC